ncbi:Type 3 secretion system secretin [subsurface metagenome]
MKIKVGILLVVFFSFLFSLTTHSLALVNGSFYDTDLREVLRSIAAQTGITTIVDDAVTGTVSVEFNKVPIEKALTMALSPGGYVFREIDDYYIVSTPLISNPAFKSLSSTVIIKPRYVDVSTVNQLLPPDLTPYIKIDEGYNLLLVTAPPAIARRIENIISSKDEPPAHIMVQVLAVEVVREKGFNLGMDWSWQWIGKLEESEGISVEELAIGYTSENILAAISALATKGEVKILSNPRVLTLDGVEAQLELETEHYFQLLAGPPEAPYFRFETVTARTGVEVRPRLTSGEEVFLDVKIAVEDLTQEAEVPRVTRRSARTRVRVGLGQTVAIAGLSEEVQREIKSKVWGLGDIPVVDLLFSRKYAMQRKTELVIFITPYVLPEELPPTRVALAAATWNIWSPKPKYAIESQQFSPKIYLGFSGCYGEAQGESQYQAEVGYAPFYGWSLSGRYGLFERDDYELSFFETRLQKEMVKIRENLYTSFSYRRREGKPRVDMGKDEFQQNVYSLSLKETNSLTRNLQLMGEVILTYVEEEGDSSPAISTVSVGPMYYLRGGLSLSGRYDYISSKQREYRQQGYAVEIEYRSPGKGWAFTAGYRDSNQESIRYLVGREPPTKGYYATIKLFLR